MRLLYPLAWSGKDRLIRQLVLNSGDWPGASKARDAVMALADVVPKGNKAIARHLCWLEYLDEAGNKKDLDLAISYYPAVDLDIDTWSCVSGIG